MEFIQIPLAKVIPIFKGTLMSPLELNWTELNWKELCATEHNWKQLRVPQLTATDRNWTTAIRTLASDCNLVTHDALVFVPYFWQPGRVRNGTSRVALLATSCVQLLSVAVSCVQLHSVSFSCGTLSCFQLRSVELSSKGDISVPLERWSPSI